MSNWNKTKLLANETLFVPSIKITDVMNNRSSKANNTTNQTTRSSRPDADKEQQKHHHQLPSYRKTRPASATAAITVFSWRKRAKDKSKPYLRDQFWHTIFIKITYTIGY